MSRQDGLVFPVVICDCFAWLCIKRSSWLLTPGIWRERDWGHSEQMSSLTAMGVVGFEKISVVQHSIWGACYWIYFVPQDFHLEELDSCQDVDKLLVLELEEKMLSSVWQLAYCFVLHKKGFCDTLTSWCVYLLLPHVTTAAHKRSSPFCPKCRWQVTAKHTCSLPIWFWITLQTSAGCMVYTKCVLRGQQFHVACNNQNSAVSRLHHSRWILQACCVKLQSPIQSHVQLKRSESAWKQRIAPYNFIKNSQSVNKISTTTLNLTHWSSFYPSLAWCRCLYVRVFQWNALLVCSMLMRWNCCQLSCMREPRRWMWVQVVATSLPAWLSWWVLASSTCIVLTFWPPLSV